jgi:lysophospholipase L1-like esterase
MVDVPWARPLRLLAYGDSNTWGFVTDAGTGSPSRLPDAERWPGVMQAALGSAVQVLVDAIPGRRTDRDADADMPIVYSIAPSALNGLHSAEAVGLSQAPLDLVIVMLGTNDLAIVPPPVVAGGGAGLRSRGARPGAGCQGLYAGARSAGAAGVPAAVGRRRRHPS